MEPVALDHLPRADLGEGPWWDAQDRRLYWVDILGHRLHRYDPAVARCETQEIGAYVSFVVLGRSGALVGGIGDGVYRFAFGSPERTLLWRPEMHAENRFNDGICDRRGRLWAGTMHVEAARERPPTGALYRLVGERATPVEHEIGISNGLGWSPDGRTMYFAETFRGIVWAYAYDDARGEVGVRRRFCEIDVALGVPDGLTVDAAGRVHVAIWRGGRINVYEPDGTLAEAVLLPVACPTSCAFGGEDLRTLFITTAARGADGDPLTAPASAGHVFTVRREVPGLPEARCVEA